jgi:hypothetical protein
LPHAQESTSFIVGVKLTAICAYLFAGDARRVPVALPVSTQQKLKKKEP